MGWPTAWGRTTRYYKYLQELNQGTQPTPSPSPTPSGGGTDEPEQEDGA